MRDYFLLAVLPFLVYAMAKRPFVALGLWIWTALFFPNGWVYGPAGVIHYNLLFAGMAILGYLITPNKPPFRPGLTGMLIFLFLAWTAVSTMTSIGAPGIAWDIWNRYLKVILLFVFVLLIVSEKLHVDFFLWCVVLSVGFYADLEGLKWIGSGGHHMIEGMPGHVLGDRNELSIAFVMTLPICYYLLGEYGSRSRVVWAGLLGTMALLVAAVIGTQSRGGFIALMALGGYLFVKSDRKLFLLLLIGVLVLVLSKMVSSEWTSRIDSINAADQDASFMGRVVAWKLSFILATQHPMFGGGFKALEYFPVWTQLAQDFNSYSWFYTGDAFPDMLHAHAAHSIYFQVLGDHGFVGLAIFVSFLVAAFRKAGKIARTAKAQAAPPWIATLATMLKLSIFVFCLGGAALSFAYFDLTYGIIGLLIVLESRILPAAKDEATR